MTPTKQVVEVGQELIFEVDIEKELTPPSSQDLEQEELKPIAKKRALPGSENAAEYDDHKPHKMGLLNQISKINALDRIKIEQE